MVADLWSSGLPSPVALAVVALVGYVCGQYQRRRKAMAEALPRLELKRAQAVARQLETIAESVRRNLALHHSSIARFKDRVFELSVSPDGSAWAKICEEAENVLGPTLRLGTELSQAYEEIRQQTGQLMTFTALRTDPLTGLSNRQALDETLDAMLKLVHRYHVPFSLVIVDVDHFEQINHDHGRQHGDHLLKQVAEILDGSVRETDVVTRFGGEEFIVVMPQTENRGASVFSDRLRQKVESQLGVSVSTGAATAIEGDTPQSLLARADSALYTAKAAGRNCSFHHNGSTIERAAPDGGTALKAQPVPA